MGTMKNILMLGTGTGELLRRNNPTTVLALQRRNLRYLEAAKREKLSEKRRWEQKSRRTGISAIEKADAEYGIMVCDSYLADYEKNIKKLKEGDIPKLKKMEREGR